MLEHTAQVLKGLGYSPDCVQYVIVALWRKRVPPEDPLRWAAKRARLYRSRERHPSKYWKGKDPIPERLSTGATQLVLAEARQELRRLLDRGYAAQVARAMGFKPGDFQQ